MSVTAPEQGEEMSAYRVVISDGGDELAMIMQLLDIARGVHYDDRSTFPLELVHPDKPLRIVVPVLLHHVGHAKGANVDGGVTWVIAGSFPDAALEGDPWLTPVRLFCGVYRPSSPWKRHKGAIIPDTESRFELDATAAVV